VSVRNRFCPGQEGSVYLAAQERDRPRSLDGRGHLPIDKAPCRAGLGQALGVGGDKSLGAGVDQALVARERENVADAGIGAEQDLHS
jgi:hypothetical protein